MTHKTRITKSPIQPTTPSHSQKLMRKCAAAKNKAGGKPDLAESQSSDRNGDRSSEGQDFEGEYTRFWGAIGRSRVHRTLGDNPGVKHQPGGILRKLEDTPEFSKEHGGKSKTK
ncbi:MAG: hypothetical protein AABW86_04815 [Candidatus Micrarchaeota archaeon]